MLDIVLTGLNHTTAPVELREKLAFNSEESAGAIEFLKAQPGIREVLLFSTCNRVEVLMTADNGQDAVEIAKKHISQVKNTPLDVFETNLYIHHGQEAVRHIFRVAASLDSMVIGEPQILGQIKEAFRTAVLKKASGVILNRLFHRAFNVAKRVRTETGIGDSAVSISYAAIELAKKIFGDLENRTVLLVGAGEMAELAVEHLIRNRVGDIFVANRTFERGVELASRFSGKAIRFEEIPSALETVDIIISSTGSPTVVISREMVKSAIRTRRNRALFFIDIAVPRDIDPEINRLNNCYVYDIDDLKGVIDGNVETRSKEAIKAERIVDEAVIRFEKWMEGLHIVPTIVDLRDKMKAMAAMELEKTMGSSLKHLSEKEKMAVARMSEALLNKILHDPIQFLKNGGCHRDESVYLSLVRVLFNLDGTD
ncbi:MAG: glutamyl-tRNA reductase [Proteobacteria bacterium]|nr:glutamyl-tRNA reductase [Pseudomonadota bacterium]